VRFLPEPQLVKLGLKGGPSAAAGRPGALALPGSAESSFMIDSF